MKRGGNVKQDSIPAHDFMEELDKLDIHLSVLHAEVDADWKKLIEPLEKEPSLNFWTICELLKLWGDEKQYVDRHHMRWQPIEWSTETQSWVSEHT